MPSQSSTRVSYRRRNASSFVGGAENFRSLHKYRPFVYQNTIVSPIRPTPTRQLQTRGKRHRRLGVSREHLK